MDNQLIQPFTSRLRAALIAIIIAIVASFGFLGIYWHYNPDPYVQEVLSVEGNVADGRAIFQINCSGCHALNTGASNSVGPNLSNIPKRKSRVEIIRQVISGRTPPMPKFQPSAKEMADLLQYLETL